ncbi:MAG TPA: inositol monophosphatase family protein [Acidimicrobiales bacterium]|jgi:myo-inositol-1(or 4)-monophosphatase|nr:inositol monophosphatase family protein [Acidimicrobiales bacterium]
MTDGASPRNFVGCTPEFTFALDAGGNPDRYLAGLAGVALEAAQAAALILISDRQLSGLETKSSATDMVSDFDLLAEQAVAQVIAARRPDDGLLGEEGSNRTGSTGVRWVVDPLDGTTNFLFGLPQFSVSIAAEIDGRPVAGVVIDPSRDEVWAAIRGHGSFLNGRRCRVAEGRSTLEQALCATGFGYRAERRRWQAAVAARVIPEVRDIRRLGSAALDLCWTGGGRYDAYFEWGLNPWDLSAGSLVASEAGGIVEAVGHRLIVATTPSLFEPLCRLLDDAGGFDAPPGPEPTNW